MHPTPLTLPTARFEVRLSRCLRLGLGALLFYNKLGDSKRLRSSRVNLVSFLFAKCDDSVEKVMRGTPLGLRLFFFEPGSNLCHLLTVCVLALRVELFWGHNILQVIIFRYWHNPRYGSKQYRA